MARNKLSRAQIKQIREMWQYGMLAKDIAQEFGVIIQTIYYHTRDIREPNGPRRNKPETLETPIPQPKRKPKELKPVDDIPKLYGLPKQPREGQQIMHTFDCKSCDATMNWMLDASNLLHSWEHQSKRCLHCGRDYKARDVIPLANLQLDQPAI